MAANRKKPGGELDMEARGEVRTGAADETGDWWPNDNREQVKVGMVL